MIRRKMLHVVIWFVVLAWLVAVWPAAAQEPAQSPAAPAKEAQLVDSLQQAAGGQARLAYHPATGKLSFFGVDLDHAVAWNKVVGVEAGPEALARDFLAAYGSLFGLSGDPAELAVMRLETRDRGRSFVRFQQRYAGVPVLGGELIVQLDAGGNVVSAGGEAAPDLSLSVTPRIDAAGAQGRALDVVAKTYGLVAGDLVAGDPALWIYSPALLGPGRTAGALVWRLEVKARDLRPVRELVLIDAATGGVALHFNQIDTVLYRKVYDNNNTAGIPLPGNEPPARIEGQGPSGVADVNTAYTFSGDTYNFYASNHGRDSVDNHGLQLVSTVRYCPVSGDCPYPNAFWNGEQMVYGATYASADDVVGHELSHGVTQYESNLFYYRQSGAMNEAFSDIWGEFVDLSNGADAPGDRWLMGEDLPIGAIRSMSSPHLYAQPERMADGAYYECGSDDGGGVHTNSGVANKAAYLLVDGGTFNGRTVTAIGMAKTAKIFYEVQTNLFTSASDYFDLYNGLYQACWNLVGTSGITAANCQEVLDAVSATEMNLQPGGCAANEAPVCDAGSPVNYFFDDLECPACARWSHGGIGGNPDVWYYPQNPNPFMDATYATSGVYNFWGDDPADTSDAYIVTNNGVAIPPNAFLHFRHSFDFEGGWDGGMVEYRAGGGSWTDAGALFTHNGYTGSLAGGPQSGRQAFTGSSGGYGSTRANLASLAGQNVQFRFRISSDANTGSMGWFIDDVRVYTCQGISYDHASYLPLVVKGGGSVTPPPINNGDFEQGRNVGWTEYSTHGWHIVVNTGFPGGVAPHGGAWAAWLGGDLNDVSYIQQQVTVPAGASYLAYYHWIASGDSCGYDRAYVRVNAANVAQYDLCTTTATGGWVRRTVNLGAYVGQSVTLQIRVQTDGSLNSNLFVDDVSFAASAAAEPGPGAAVDPAWAAPHGGD